jgi:CDP-2,3-bis-(O-geranylgeranyl)-sn-glycerol synthase
MLDDIIFSIIFFLPAGIANATPVFAAKIPFLRALDIPLDAGKTFHGVRIFGDHKTIRGFASGIVTAIITTYLIREAYIYSTYLQNISQIDYSAINPIILGFLLGFGALFGDAIKSFFKRRTNIEPGKSWFPFDQIDYIIGGLLFSALYIPLLWSQYLITTLVWFCLHLISVFAGFLIGIRKEPI